MARKKGKPSSYSDYTLDDLQTICGIGNVKQSLNLAQNPIEPSEWLRQSIGKGMNITLNSEKAKSEWLVVPILTELHEKNIGEFNIFSGNTFDVLPEKFLIGRCDYLINKGNSANITAPVVGIFEAKDDSLEKWYGQCGAEMYAAKLFNEQRNENEYAVIYGAVTNGFEWIFLKLENNMLFIDTFRYNLENIAKLLSALQQIINFISKK